MSVAGAEMLEAGDGPGATVRMAQRAQRDAQWRAWLAASAAGDDGASRPGISDLTRRGSAARRPQAGRRRRLAAIMLGLVVMLVI